MKRANYDSLPLAIEAVGNGSYLYRWDIEEVTTEATDDQEAHTSWECYEVTVGNEPTTDLITLAVIDFLWGDGVEQKYLNDYYAAVEGILAESYKQNYLDFLVQRKVLKEQIAADYVLWSNN